MNCQECVCFLEAMPLCERTRAQMEAIHQHAHQCLSCAQRLLRTSKTEHELSHLAIISPPVDMATHVMERLTPAPFVPPAPARSRATGFFWWVTGPIAALVTMAVCLQQTELTTWLKPLVIPRMTRLKRS